MNKSIFAGIEWTQEPNGTWVPSDPAEAQSARIYNAQFQLIMHTISVNIEKMAKDMLTKPVPNETQASPHSF